MTDLTTAGFGTRVVHAGERMTPGNWKPVAAPIQPSVAYTYDGMDELDKVFAGEEPGYVYGRFGSPTVAALESAVADLERGDAAQAYGSGMAAIHGALLACGARAGAHLVAASELYGATRSLITGLLGSQGVTCDYVDVLDLDAVAAGLRRAPCVAMVVETVSNPLLHVADLEALASLTHRHGAALVVDNTFATPYLCNPLALGADLVVHSATKYLGGHGDVTAGVAITTSERRRLLNENIRLTGGVLGPFEAWLVLRGLKTLALRMRRQCEGAARIAAWLAGQSGVRDVFYPGSAGGVQQALAAKQFGGKGFGGIVSFKLAKEGRQAAFRFMSALKLCQAGTTLGDVYSLALHPATASHRGLEQAERDRLGITDDLVRLSVGIEDVEDIIADLRQALDAA